MRQAFCHLELHNQSKEMYKMDDMDTRAQTHIESPVEKRSACSDAEVDPFFSYLDFFDLLCSHKKGQLWVEVERR